METIDYGGWATRYAKIGWPVFPLVPGQKIPHKNTKGVLEASTDPDRIEYLWDLYPGSNIGVATGSAFDVLDLDSDRAVDMTEEAGWPKPGPMVKTGNGIHLYLKTTPGGRNRAGLLDKQSGIDYRAKGGYVVLPPSLHPSGHRYSWLEHDIDLDKLVLPAAPGWLAKLVVPPPPNTDRSDYRPPPTADGTGTPYGRKALENQCSEVAHAPDGTRNHTLNAAAYAIGQLIAGGELHESPATQDLFAAGRSAGLPEFEINRTIDSGIKAGAGNPRHAPERPR